MNIIMNVFAWWAIGMSICILLDVFTNSRFQKSEFILGLIWPVIPIAFLVFEMHKIIDRLYGSRY